MRRAVLAFALSILCITTSAAGEPKEKSGLHFGIEWGYGQGIFKYRHINIVSQEGYRINEVSRSLWTRPNGILLAKIGYDIHEKVNLSLCAGWAGISDGCQTYPLLLRASFAPKGLYSEGFYSFIDGGIGFRRDARDYSKDILPIFDAGEAYRIRLTPRLCLDFIISIRAAFDSPLIPNPEGSGTVQKENIRHNVAEFYSADFSVALTF